MAQDSMYDRALEIAVEARTLAVQAHSRQDNMDRAIDAIQSTLGELSAAVASLNTKVAIAAGFGSLLGGGLIAAVITYLTQ